MRVGNFQIGDATFIIAEVGSNHCGDPDVARRSVLAAAECGADAVKFQMYDPDKLVDPAEPVLSYIAQTHKSQRDRFRSLQLSSDLFRELAELARKAGLLFLVTPFDEEAVSFLDPLVPAFKVASGDLTNLRLLRAVAARGKPVLLSTGMATLEEIDQAIEEIPKDRLILLHCIGAYPTPDEEVGLQAIPFLRERYRLPIGWSDHTRGGTAAVAAVAVGAEVVEKHFVLSRNLPAADQALSVDPGEFRAMVEEIRRVERMRGSPGRKVTASESYFRERLRRAVYAREQIPAGAEITADMLIALRPCGPEMVPADQIDNLVGKRVRRAIARESPLHHCDFVG